MCTHPTADGGQTDGHGNMIDELFDGHRDTADGDQTDGCRYSVFGDNLDTKTAHWYRWKRTKNVADGDQTDGYRHSADELRFEG